MYDIGSDSYIAYTDVDILNECQSADPNNLEQAFRLKSNKDRRCDLPASDIIVELVIADPATRRG